MEMREIVSLLEAKIKMKIHELSRMEKEVAIAKSVIRNDIQQLYKILSTHCPKFDMAKIEEGENHEVIEVNKTELQNP